MLVDALGDILADALGDAVVDVLGSVHVDDLGDVLVAALGGVVEDVAILVEGGVGPIDPRDADLERGRCLLEAGVVELVALVLDLLGVVVVIDFVAGIAAADVVVLCAGALRLTVVR